MASLGEDAPGAKSIYAMARNVAARLARREFVVLGANGADSLGDIPVRCGRRIVGILPHSWRSHESSDAHCRDGFFVAHFLTVRDQKNPRLHVGFSMDRWGNIRNWRSTHLPSIYAHNSFNRREQRT